jgi:two-component system OmpR family sensor kinase
MIRQKSLEHELRRWIILTALAFVILGGVIAGGVAFYQARELQDHTLLEIAVLVRSGMIADSQLVHHDIEEGTIIINEIGKKQHVPIIPSSIMSGLHTMKLDGNHWRILIITQANTQRRFSIAQQTELRDKIAWSSGLSVFLPIALLVVIMLLMIHLIIKRQFRSLGLLTKVIEKQDITHLNELPDRNIPVEIAPFVHSINTLLGRVRLTLQKQQRFIADAAHELRTPIAALSLQVENLAQAKTSIDRDKRQKQLRYGLERLRSLVAQLLDLARLQSDVEHHVQKVSLNKIVHGAIEDLIPLAEANKIDLGMIRQEENIIVADQQGRLSQLVHNAIDNAIHYSSSGSKVDISLFMQKGKAVFIVEDNGIGIPEADLEQVLQPFYRVQESHKPGNGLGLAISHEISLRLGGEIRLINRETGGLCFLYEQPII